MNTTFLSLSRYKLGYARGCDCEPDFDGNISHSIGINPHHR